MDEDDWFIIDLSADIGDDVICDFCNADYSESDDCGGVLVGSWAACPECALEMSMRASQYGAKLDAVCPDGTSFADFVRQSRNA
jgi:ssDNA-binding Zn-finger/Zn-ribbon topoisomerase 1